MDHTPSHFSPAHASANYQPIPYEETQGHGGEESEQNDLGGPTTSEPDTSENENADPQDGEMPRIERHGLCLATTLGDVAAVASPIAFIVFTVMVLCLDGSEASEASFAKWNNATTVVCDPCNGRVIMTWLTLLTSLAHCFPSSLLPRSVVSYTRLRDGNSSREPPLAR